MRTFLEQPEATFYHITCEENWQGITQHGLVSADSRIFVSRVGEMPVLASIAIEQLPEIRNTKAIRIIKIPQALNGFSAEQIVRDPQADNLWTRDFHNIILCDRIPFDRLELMMTISFRVNREFVMMQLNQYAAQGDHLYANHAILNRARNLVYTV